MIEFIAIYFLLGVLSAAYVIGKLHGNDLINYPRLNNGIDQLFVVVIVLSVFAPIASVLVVGIRTWGNPWVWPKKGVTYQ